MDIDIVGWAFPASREHFEHQRNAGFKGAFEIAENFGAEHIALLLFAAAKNSFAATLFFGDANRYLRGRGDEF
jgi:hypothetical protein